MSNMAEEKEYINLDSPEVIDAIKNAYENPSRESLVRLCLLIRYADAEFEDGTSLYSLNEWEFLPDGVGTVSWTPDYQDSQVTTYYRVKQQ